MKKLYRSLMLCALLTCSVSMAHASDTHTSMQVQLGPRPFYLIDQMQEGKLKAELQACAKNPSTPTDFSIGHRGAPMQFPEHTRESYIAAARMGAGILECDVTFTSDLELVCRHSQCDLHSSTNILAIPELAEKCSVPFKPAVIDSESGKLLETATAQCCTSDITLLEFKSLQGKMDASDPAATDVKAYMAGTANWRTDLYAGSGTLMTHAESIALFQSLGVKMTPELKPPSVVMPYKKRYTQEEYALQLIQEYREAGVDPKNVFPQSFDLNDILFWIDRTPKFGAQAIYLDDEVYKNHPRRLLDAEAYSNQIAAMPGLAEHGIKYIAPPLWVLLALDENQQPVPSAYAEAARHNGIDLITWTLERSGLLKNGGGWYYQTTSDSLKSEGDLYEILDVLAQDVGIKGIFSDWPATVTYYANCKGL